MCQKIIGNKKANNLETVWQTQKKLPEIIANAEYCLGQKDQIQVAGTFDIQKNGSQLWTMVYESEQGQMNQCCLSGTRVCSV